MYLGLPDNSSSYFLSFFRRSNDVEFRNDEDIIQVPNQSIIEEISEKLILDERATKNSQYFSENAATNFTIKIINRTNLYDIDPWTIGDGTLNKAKSFYQREINQMDERDADVWVFNPELNQWKCREGI